MRWKHTPRVVRPVAGTVLAVLATMLLFPSVIANWARTNVYDRENFADHAEVALEDDAVRAALVRGIVDRLIEVGPPEALSIRPLLELVTSTVVDTQAFADIYRTAVEDAHEDIFEGEAGTAPIALTLVDALVVIVAMIEQAYPEVADRLPPPQDVTFIELRQRDWTIDIATVGQDIDYFAFIAPALAGGLYLLALAIAPHRRSMIAAVGFGWITVGAILVVGREFAGDIVIDRAALNDPAVGEAIWDVYTRSLTGWAILLGGVGLALAILGTGTRRRVEPRAHMAWLTSFLSRPPGTIAQAARAVLIVGAALLVVRQPIEMIEIAALVAGGYAMYYGISELIWLAGPGTSRLIQEQPRRAHVEPSAMARAVALRSSAVLLLVFAGLAGVLVSWQAIRTAGGEPTIASADADTCNGHAELCDRRFDEVAFLGAHNAMAAANEPNWYFAQQLSGLNGQLEFGVRALLLDTWYGYSTGRGVRTADRDFIAHNLPPEEYSPRVIDAARRLERFIGERSPNTPRGTYLCHAFCELGATPLQEGLAGINGFLDRHEDEVVVLFLQDQISPEDTAKAFIASGLASRVYRPVPGEPWPTLREMIERNERVVVFADNNAAGIDWYAQAFDFVQETEFHQPTMAGLSCARGRGQPDHPLFALNHWLTEGISTTGRAAAMNDYDFLLSRAEECSEERRQDINFVVLDFAEVGDGLAVVDALNGVGSGEPAAQED